MSTATAPTLDLNDPEFTLAPADFERIRQLIYQRAGISLHAGKQAMVYSRLARRLRETRHTGFSAYLQWLEKGAPDSEWQEFVNCLTTNLTSFFREDHHFLALVEDLRARASRPLRIWCNAASTGEEPYSLAMTAVETLGVSAQVKLVCSDIDTNVLATARRGVYNGRRTRPVARAAAAAFPARHRQQRRQHPRQARTGAPDRVPQLQPDEP
jgi:chemotaxis protein methyltransferase CheR